jgi:peptidoglycan/xylan/chitin deacetylase (PgdA/CDA1 family)
MPLAPFLPLIYQILSPAFPGCLWAGSAASPAIALTFDDGPHPQHTPQLLEVLDHYQVPASFFWLGSCVNLSPDVAHAVYQRAHWIGLHGYTHRSFPTLSAAELKQSLEQTQWAIAQACHLQIADVQQQIRDVRPPNGLFTPQTLAHLRQWNYRSIMWSVVPEDWVQPGVEVVIQRVLRQTCNGSVIVLHYGYCGGVEVAAIAAQIIPQLLQAGYCFVTIDQLWRQRSLQAF